MKSRVTTKQGDAGKTRTLGGDVVSKSDAVIACCGAVDELRAQIALLRCEAREATTKDIEEELTWLLHICFVMGTLCSDPENKHPEYRRGVIDEAALARLEGVQSRMESALNLPRAFIVGAANRPAAQADVTATVTRRLERSLVAMSESVAQFECVTLLAFVNRLSDFFFIFARFLEGGKHEAVNYAVLEGGTVAQDERAT